MRTTAIVSAVVVPRLVELVQIRPATMGQAFAIVAYIATARPRLSASQLERIRIASMQRAGLVSLRRNRRSRTMIGIYSEKAGAGLECDSSLPWSVVCEDHGTLVSCSTLEEARGAASCPDFCETCCDAMFKAG